MYSLLSKNKPIVISASTDRLAYFPGERIEVLDPKVINGSSRTLTNVKVEFIQKITYKARGNGPFGQFVKLLYLSIGYDKTK